MKNKSPMNASKRNSVSPSKLMSSIRDPTIEKYKPMIKLLAKHKASTPKYENQEQKQIMDRVNVASHMAEASVEFIKN